jgi:hypothetical protein
MQKQKSGHIINMASVFGIKIFAPGGTVYWATKIRCARLDGRTPDGVTFRIYPVHDDLAGAVESELKNGTFDPSSAAFMRDLYNLNPAHSASGMPRNRLIDGPYRRFWYSEPYLTLLLLQPDSDFLKHLLES